MKLCNLTSNWILLIFVPAVENSEVQAAWEFVLMDRICFFLYSKIEKSFSIFNYTQKFLITKNLETRLIIYVTCMYLSVFFGKHEVQNGS